MFFGSPLGSEGGLYVWFTGDLSVKLPATIKTTFVHVECEFWTSKSRLCLSGPVPHGLQPSGSGLPTKMFFGSPLGSEGGLYVWFTGDLSVKLPATIKTTFVHVECEFWTSKSRLCLSGPVPHGLQPSGSGLPTKMFFGSPLGSERGLYVWFAGYL